MSRLGPTAKRAICGYDRAMAEPLEPSETVRAPEVPPRDETGANLADLDRYAEVAREYAAEADATDRGIGPGDAVSEAAGIEDVAPHERWREATPSERLEMARTMHNQIRENYGLAPQALAFDSDLGQADYGYWTPESGVIINEQMVMQDEMVGQDGYEATVRTLAHENRHALQHEVMYAGRDVGPATDALRERWRTADAEYGQPPWTYERYRANALEADTHACEDRVWAELRSGRRS